MLHWVDHPGTTKHERRHHHRTQHGRYYSGFVDSYGLLFTDFNRMGKDAKCAQKLGFAGLPVGLLILIAHRGAAGSVGGFFKGPGYQTQMAQCGCLMFTNMCLAVYILCARPFLVKMTNYMEAVVAISLCTALAMNLWYVNK